MTLRERIMALRPCDCIEARRIAPHSVAEHDAQDASRVALHQSPFTRRAIARELPGKELGR